MSCIRLCLLLQHSWARKHFGLSHSVPCALLSNYSQKTPMWQLAPRLASWAQLFASLHACVCVCKGGKGVQHKTSITLHFILSCLRVCVSVLMLHPVVQVSAIIVHWLSSKLRMFQATHLRVTDSVIQSVSQSLIHAFIQVASQANSSSKRIAFKCIRTIASLPANIRKVRWVKTFRFFGIKWYV